MSIREKLLMKKIKKREKMKKELAQKKGKEQKQQAPSKQREKIATEDGKISKSFFRNNKHINVKYFTWCRRIR